jgi:hypothetical protein
MHPKEGTWELLDAIHERAVLIGKVGRSPVVAIARDWV